jgi:Family of unknown function (DUF5988)
MTESTEIAVTAVLEGGPSDLPVASRSRRITGTPDKIKIEHLGGHEHFERTDEAVHTQSGEEVVYRWTTRTWVAE